MADRDITQLSAEQQPDVIRIDCDKPGFEDCYVLFKRAGWKFRHLRIWEDATSAAELAAIIAERIDSWSIHDADDKTVEFMPKKSIRNAKGKEIVIDNERYVMDELPSQVAAWLVTVYREAYRNAILPNPKNSLQPPVPDNSEQS